jgi:hypothetical protein
MEQIPQVVKTPKIECQACLNPTTLAVVSVSSYVNAYLLYVSIARVVCTLMQGPIACAPCRRRSMTNTSSAVQPLW